MMLDGEEHNLVATNQVQEQIVIHDEFSEVIVFTKPTMHLVKQSLPLF